jgi:hypothetical protein
VVLAHLARSGTYRIGSSRGSTVRASWPMTKKVEPSLSVTSRLNRRIVFPERLARYARLHPFRGSLIQGLGWGLLMFLFWCAVTVFTDVEFTLEITLATTAFFTLCVLVTNLWLGRRASRTHP